MKVYGAPISPFVRKVIVTLKLKGLDFDLEPVIPGSVPEGFKNISPLEKIPAFEDGGVALADSTVICEYLEDQYPEQPARPDSPALRAQARWLEEYSDTKLVELCGGGLFFERFAKPLLMQEPTDEARVADTINNLLPPQQDYLEALLPASGFLFGDDLMTADISIVSHFINAGYAQYDVDAGRWPRLASYIDRVKQHPVVAAQLAEEADMMAGFDGG